MIRKQAGVVVAKAALKLVEKNYERSLEDLDGTTVSSTHAAHSLCYFPGTLPPRIAAFLVKALSREGERVLSAGCRGGTLVLESVLQKRELAAFDNNPLSVRIAKALLFQGNIADVVLRLQFMNLTRPVNLSSFNGYFDAFYHPSTYRELVNLRRELQSNRDSVSEFIEAVAMSLLHGHSSGFFSTYSLPHVGLLPQEQRDLNARRGESPEYRAIVPRILKKAAFLIQEPFSDSVGKVAARGEVFEARSTRLPLDSNSVDLAVFSPPLPMERHAAVSFWLKHWFCGISKEEAQRSADPAFSPDLWIDYMNEAFVELMRVVRPGRHLVFHVGHLRQFRRGFNIAEDVKRLIESCFARQWEVREELLVHSSGSFVKTPAEVSQDEERDVHMFLLLERKHG